MKYQDNELIKYLLLLEEKLKKIYGSAYKDVLKIKEVRNNIENGNKDFSFDKNPAANRQMERVLKELYNRVNSLIQRAMSYVWNLGKKNVQVSVLKQLGGTEEKDARIKEITKKAEQDHRAGSANAGMLSNEKRGGLNLSQRVWNLNGNAKSEIESIIQAGIKEGKSSDEISRSIQKYLNNPDALFRSVKDKKTGKMGLSKAAKNYHPGQGVYRSAYKNAMRLMRTEVNRAYRRAEWMLYQTDPLIVGYRVVLSNNHTTLINGKRVPLVDICDELQGEYPKAFLFEGWHPQCRCGMIPIVISTKEFGQYIKAQEKGETFNSENEVKDVPAGFKKWIDKNKARIAVAQENGKLPYWMKDNAKYIDTLAEKQDSKGIIGKEDNQILAANGVLSDPFGVNSFLSMVDFMRNKVTPKMRKIAFEKMLKSEEYTEEKGVYFMKGAAYSETEKQTAIKLSKEGYHVVFPSERQIKGIKKTTNDNSDSINDVYLYDKKTYLQRKADIKTIHGASPETISKHIIKGSQQAPVVVMDITGNISKYKLIEGIRSGWTKNTKIIIFNYKGQWYEVTKKNVYNRWL
jgi:hypothetical protein